MSDTELPRFMEPHAPDPQAVVVLRARTGSGVAKTPSGELVARVRCELTGAVNRSHQDVQLVLYLRPELAAEWGRQLIDNAVASVQDLAQLGPEIEGESHF